MKVVLPKLRFDDTYCLYYKITILSEISETFSVSFKCNKTFLCPLPLLLRHPQSIHRPLGRERRQYNVAQLGRHTGRY